MLYFSKSKYCGLWQCPKIAWLQKYKPEEMYVEGGVASRLAAGNEVGDLAMGIFGDYVEVTAYKGEKINLSKMIENKRIQNCIIHQLRNSSKYVSYKDMKALMADLKAVYGAVDEQSALDALDSFAETWDK